MKNQRLEHENFRELKILGLARHTKSHNIFHAPAIQARFSDGPKFPIPVLSKNHFTIFTKIMKTVVLFV